MKFKLKITKDILFRSRYCGTFDSIGVKVGNIAESCAFALAFNELIPHVAVGNDKTLFFGKNGTGLIAEVLNTQEQYEMIKMFDFVRTIDNPELTAKKRMVIPEQEFEVEIPDNVIEYWHGDAVTAVQKLIDNPILQPINPNNQCLV